MTLTVAWERSISTSTELVFASDSRLRSEGAWDAGPKIFRLPRTDALLAFAGETLWAYPIVLQMIATMDANDSSRGRYFNLTSARALAMRSMEAMMQSGEVLATRVNEIELEFLFGGWNWREGQFRLWRIYWSRGEGRLRHEPIEGSRTGKVRFIGTRDRDRSNPSLEVVGDAKSRLSRKLQSRYGSLPDRAELDLEPWEVLIEMLRSGAYPTIGGPPQLAKVYRYMDTRTFAVRWPDRDSGPTLMGRRLLEDELTDAPEVDPDKPRPSFYEDGVDHSTHGIAPQE
jgi:hypothetical protein